MKSLSLSSSSFWGWMPLTMMMTMTLNSHTAAQAANTKTFYSNKDLPPGDWQSMGPRTQFLAAPTSNDVHTDYIHQLSRQLEQQQNNNNDDDGPRENNFEQDTDDVYRVQPFAEGITEYDEYQQAWRMLGFMIDCDDARVNQNGDDDYNNNNNQDSYDGGTGEGCHRYVLWAAYIDLNYQGAGIGEYQYWDRDTQSWDDTPCYHSDLGDGTKSRCAKMDCHLEDTHWTLLGFFKHQSYDDWMEQLFKHEGVCVWTQEEYKFMQAARETWPQGCSDSGTTDANGNPIYYDLKPVVGGGMAAGLYTDTQCVEEYKPYGNDDPISVANILGNFLVDGEASHDSGDDDVVYDFSSYTFEQAWNMWDSTLDAFKICQPCIAHDLQNYNGNNNNQNNNNGGNWWNRYRNNNNNNNDDGGGGDDDAYNNNNNYNGDDEYANVNFACYDDADYTNVNQCMKFMAKTTMNTATFRDLSLARMQGTLADSPLAGFMTSNGRKSYYRRASFGTFLTYLWLLVSAGMAFYGYTYFARVRRETNFQPTWNPKEPLMVFS